jgi:plastocyanin domain-containing protein
MKPVFISIIMAAVLIGGSLIISGRGAGNDDVPSRNNVSVVDGRQIIEITAKGGYLPRRSVAKAGLPTSLRFNTEGTFDCSSAVRIPSLGISRNLPQSGVAEIDLGNPRFGVLQGTCGMGMYWFEVDFQG